tara:strand:- start:67 stop:261 length:195 start_codon:yes stop_codon:yes gene_type:complete
MALNDELYSRLVNLYQDLDNQQILQLNARLILLLSEAVSDPLALGKIIDQVEAENKNSGRKKIE